MRILFWNTVYLPHLGGVEIFTARLAAGLIARGHKVGVVAQVHTPGLPPHEVIDGVEVFRLPFQEAVTHPDPIARIRLIKAATTHSAEIKRAFRPDVVHLNVADAGPLFHLRTVDAWPAASIATFQAALQKPATGEGNVVAAIVAGADRVVGVSRFAAGNIAAFTRAPLQDIAVVYPGIPPEEFAPAPSLPAGPPTIAFLGRLVEEKGADVAVSALARLPAPARLLIVGDGPRRAEIETLARELGVAGRVDFAGQVSDAERRRLLAGAIAMVVPSKHEELFGMVAAEGALSGLAVVASAIGGLQEIVVPGETGDLVPPGDPAALAAALAPLLADPALARRMGEAGRLRCLAHFTVDRTVDAYEDLYRASQAARQPAPA